MGTLKPQSNGQLNSITMTDDRYTGRRWATSARSPPRPRPILVVRNVTAHSSTASVSTSYYSVLH